MGPLNQEKRTRSVDMLLEAVCKSWVMLSGMIFPLISVVLVFCSLICLIAPVILASDSNVLLNHFSSKLLPTWQRQRVYGLLTVTQLEQTSLALLNFCRWWIRAWSSLFEFFLSFIAQSHFFFFFFCCFLFSCQVTWLTVWNICQFTDIPILKCDVGKSQF